MVFLLHYILVALPVDSNQKYVRGNFVSPQLTLRSNQSC